MRAGAVRKAPKGTRALDRATPGRPLRWNPEPDEVRKSVVRLVLTLVELIRRLMERQAIRRVNEGTLTTDETEAVGRALMDLERTIGEIAHTFDLSPEELNLDLGGIDLM